MIKFIIGFLIGGMTGIVLMSLLQINKVKEQTND